MIKIIDYGAGNIHSVANALISLNEQYEIVTDNLDNAQAVILPGVGAFGEAMYMLKQRGLDNSIKRYIQTGKPFLGICLGLQLLFDRSEENPETAGLGIFSGQILRIPNFGVKIPHIGWNSLDIKTNSSLLAGCGTQPFVYFVHSYYLQSDDKSIVSATTEYGTTLEVAIKCENVQAVQFHPEKSGDVGLTMLKNFIGAVKDAC